MSVVKKARLDNSLSDHSSDLSSLDDLREANTRLRAAIDAEHNQIKQLRREKAVEIKTVMEREQNKASIALKDQRLKLLQDKTSELERQKEATNKKFEADAAKIARQKETEINKIRDALTRCQTELSQVKVKGLSGDKARVNSFEGERAKYVREAADLRAQKKQLEIALKEAENKRRLDLVRAQQAQNTEVNKVRREADAEIRKLVEDIKGRDRQMAQLERDLQIQVAEATRFKIERDNMHQTLKENEDIKRSPRKPALSSSLADVSDSLDNPPGENGYDREPILKRQISELNIQIKRLEEQCSSYKQDKADLVRKIADVERRQRPLGEKARRFLEKNMELTSINRSLEERIKALTDDNNKLKSQLEKDREEAARLSRSLDEEREEHEAYTSLELEVELLRQQVMEQDKTMTALKLACTEKDRRIELICHRRRKQRAVKAQQKMVRFLLVPASVQAMAAGIKETYYGYDEDRSSVDSEMSTSSRLSSSRLSLDNTFDEDDVFDEFTREEFHRNYQRLAREHLELEKSCALLQSQVALSHVDPQREFKLRSQLEDDLLSAQSRIEDLMKMVTEKGQREEQQDTKWLDEKEKLNANMKSLKDKIGQHEATITNLRMTVQESQEQNEELEFRCLELEESNRKMSEDARQCLTFSGPVTLSQDGVLELYAEEQGLVEVKLDDLRSRLQQLTELQNGHFTRDEQVALLQTYALLNIIDQKLKENQEVEDELKSQLRQLEEELLDLHAAGVSKELADIHKETVAKLEEAEKKLQELSSEVEELRKADAIHKYTEDFNQKAEERYKVEINSLRRQLSNSREGRDYENELFLEKTTRLKELEQLVAELQAKNKLIEGDLESARRDKADLEDQLAMEEETQSLTESDKDTPTLLHSLRSKISQHEKMEHELSEQKGALQMELANLKSRLREYECNESELTEKNFTMQEDLETTKRKHKVTAEDLLLTREELRTLQTQVSVGSVPSPRGREPDTVSIGSMSEADLSEDNQSMRVELFSLREQLKMKDIEISRLGKSVNSNTQWKITSLEKELMDLRHENVTLKERLREKMKELDTIEDELGTSIVEKKGRIRELQEDLAQSREENVSMETMVVDMKQQMFGMQEKLDIIGKGVKEAALIKMQDKIMEMEDAQQALQEDLEAITASRSVLKDNAESLLRKETEYHEQISDLHSELKVKEAEIDALDLSQQTLREDKDKLESHIQELESHHSRDELVEKLKLQVKELKEKMSATDPSKSPDTDSAALVQPLQKKIRDLEKQVKDCKERELQARDQLDLVVDEKDRRILFLQEQLDHMEESEACLNESLADMRQLENQLREQLKNYEDFEKTGSTTSASSDMELEITKLRSTEGNLLGRIEELEETAETMRKELATRPAPRSHDAEEHEVKTEEEKSDESKTGKNERVEKYRKRCHDLEARVKELSGHESDLMEQIYAMQLENQELQEHIDLLQDGSDHDMDEEEEDEDVQRGTVQTVSAKQTAASKPEKVGEVKEDKVAKMEVENAELRDQLLKAKLDAMGTTTVPNTERVSELEARVSQLEKREEELVSEVESLQALQRKVAQLEEHKGELESELEEHDKSERQFCEKIRLLEQSEDKLMEELDTLAERESSLKEENESLRMSGQEASAGHRDLMKHIHHLEEQENELKTEIADLEGRRSDLLGKLDKARKSESSEVQRLQEKVDILLDTEERLIDRLQEQDHVEMELKEKLEVSQKDGEDFRQKLVQTEKDAAELRNNLQASKNHIEETKEKLGASEKEMEEVRKELEMLSQTEQQHSTELREQLQKAGSFDQEKSELKEQLGSFIQEKSDLSKSLATFKEENSELSKAMEASKRQCSELENRLDEKEKEVAQLRETLGALEIESTAKQEKLSIYEEETVKLITKLKSSEVEVSHLKEKLESNEKESAQLKDDLKKMKDLEESQKEAEKLTIESTHRLRELELEVERLTMQIISDEKELHQLRDKLKKMEEMERLYEESEKHMRMSKLRIFELETSEKEFKEQVNELEKAEAILLTKIDGLETTITELRNTEGSLRQQISDHQHNEGSLNRRLVDLEKSEVRLQTKVSDLEVQNTTLMATVNSATQQKESHMHYHITEPKETVTVLGAAVSDTAQRSASPKRFFPSNRTESRSPSPTRRWDDLGDLERLEGMSRDELLLKVHELETMERFHRRRIQELSNNLAHFRQAVEVVAVTMETDTDVPVVNYRPKTKDSEYEAKVAELVKTEVHLKLKVFQLQKQEALLKAELVSSEQRIKDMERDFHSEVEELEEELDNARKAEARWKNKLQYGQIGQENQAIAKVQHLENLVFDLEASERKLQRRVHELQDSEETLRLKLKAAEEAAKEMSRLPVDEKDQYYTIIKQVLAADSSEKELKENITKLGQDDSHQKVRRIAELERSERILKKKVEMLECQELIKSSYTGDEMNSPEDILKQRIQELEKMDQHLKKQIMELEHDREELYEITRHDKSTVHELNVTVRELQLSEKNLKDQANRYEATESRLTLTIDELNDRIQHLEDTVQKLQTSEKQLKLALQTHKSTRDDLGLQLENTVVESQRGEQRLKKKVADLESEKQSLRERTDELTDRVGDLEGIELTLKSKLKSVESSELDLKNRLSELDHSESVAKTRTMELEAFNETLSQKAHELGEENSSLRYEMSDLQTSKDDLGREVERLKLSLKTLKERLSHQEGSESGLAQRVEEAAEREAALMSKVAEYERMDAEWQSRVAALEANEAKLRLMVQQMEGSLSMANSKTQASDDIEKENSQLHQQLLELRSANTSLETEKHHVVEKLELFEHAHSNKTIATVPREELVELRAQVTLLAEMEKTIAGYERSEMNLKATISKLREGKDACGHEGDLQRLKDEVNHLNATLQEREGLKRALNTTKKAHELLKENHEETKKELAQVLNRLKSGEVKVAHPQAQMSSKAIQARLAQTYTLRDVSPELRTALKGLGAKHPDAYQEFVRTLQPGHVARPTKSKGVSKKKVAVEDTIIVQSAATTTMAQNPPSSHGDRTPAALGTQPKSTLFTIGEGRKGHTKDMGSELGSVTEEIIVPLVLKGELISRVAINAEDPLWASIEQSGSTTVDLRSDREESYWANIENTAGEVDDMTLCLTFVEETDSDGSLSHRPALRGSTTSLHSNISDLSLPPPPLPNTLPPPSRTMASPSNESYYLPSSHHGEDSADEASEIVDEDDATYGLTHKRRAKSADRDSDFSEILPLGSSPQQVRRRKKLSQHTSSLESIPDSGVGTLRQTDGDMLREKISAMEKQLKVKEKELELAQHNQRELERKAKDADEAFTWKAKLKDRERQLEVERKKMSDLKDKCNGVEMQLSDREFDVERLKADIDRLQKALKVAPESPDANESYLREQLERKDKEVSAKSNEVDRLIQELRKTQDESRAVQDEHQKMLEELHVAQTSLESHNDLTTHHTELQLEHSALVKEHGDLVDRHAQFTQTNDEKAALEKIVLKLKGQLNDLERIDLERQDLQTRLNALEAELKQTKHHESELAREMVSLRLQLQELTVEHDKLSATHADYTKVIMKYKNMEDIKNKAQLMVTPLRAKVIRLSQKCQEKDNLINRLATDLRHSGEPSDLLAETDRATTLAASEEYNRPVTPLPADIFEEPEAVIIPMQSVYSTQQSRPRTTSHGSSVGSSSADSALDDTTNGFTNNNNKPLRSSSERKRGKADGKVSKHTNGDKPHHRHNERYTIDDLVVSSTLTSQPVTFVGNGDHSSETHTWPRKAKVHSGHGQLPTATLFRAIKNYEPEHFSQSGHQSLELQLKENQQVRVLGPIDNRGYYEAEVEGKIGLVPANYLQPMESKAHSKHHKHHYANKPARHRGEERSPEQILAMHAQLQQSHVPQHHVSSSRPQSGGGRLHTIVHPAFRKPALPPMRSTTMPRPRTANKHPTSRQRHSMMPSSGQTPNQNGLLMPASLCRSLPSLPDSGGVPTNGVQSPPPVDNSQSVDNAPVLAPPAPPTNFHIERIVGEHAVLLTWQPPHMDEQARSNGSTVTGYLIYINNRDKQVVPSPHMPKALVERLNLRRPNRFSIQSVASNGQKSHVTDVLFEDVLPEPRPGRELAGQGDASSVVSSSQNEDGERRVFMAVYDYNPTEHSPNDFPSQELSFRAGELITVYGSVQPDGFYQAKLHGRRGLVPASFTEEVPLLRSHSRRSLSGSSQQGSRPNSRPSSIHGNLPKVATAQV